MRFGKEDVCSYNKNLCSVRPQRRSLRLLVCLKRIIRTSAKLKMGNDEVVSTSSTCRSNEFTAFLSYTPSLRILWDFLLPKTFTTKVSWWLTGILISPFVIICGKGCLFPWVLFVDNKCQKDRRC